MGTVASVGQEADQQRPSRRGAGVVNTWLSLSSRLWSCTGPPRAQPPGSQVATEPVGMVPVDQAPEGTAPVEKGNT